MVARFQPAASAPEGLLAGVVLASYGDAPVTPGLTLAELGVGWVNSSSSGDVFLPRFCALVRDILSLLTIPPFSAHQEMAFPRLLDPRTADLFGLNSAWPPILYHARPLPEPTSQTTERILDPVQCAPFYEWAEGRRFESWELPLRVTEVLGGWSFRNERADALRPVLKAREFLRQEFVFLGEPDDVVGVRAQLVEGILGILSSLQIASRLIVGKGCFEEAKGAVDFEKVQVLGEIPVLDVEVFLPEFNEWIEVAGATSWRGELTSTFDIRSATGGTLHSGCVGIGVSRLAAALLLQAGPEVSARIREVVRCRG